jgi:hypothetical protein
VTPMNFASAGKASIIMKRKFSKAEQPVIHKDIEMPDREVNYQNIELLDSVLQDHVKRQSEYYKID